MRKENFVQTVRKITDEELIHFHSMGLSDRAIARKFGMGHNTIYFRRCKLGLVANFYPKKTKEELLARKTELRKIMHETFKKSENYKFVISKSAKEYASSEHGRERIRKYMKDYVKRDYVLKKTKEYENSSKRKNMRKEYGKVYWQREYVKKNGQERKYKKRWSNLEEREIGRCNQILSGLLNADEKNEKR